MENECHLLLLSRDTIQKEEGDGVDRIQEVEMLGVSTSLPNSKSAGNHLNAKSNHLLVGSTIASFINGDGSSFLPQRTAK